MSSDSSDAQNYRVPGSDGPPPIPPRSYRMSQPDVSRLDGYQTPATGQPFVGTLDGYQSGSSGTQPLQPSRTSSSFHGSGTGNRSEPPPRPQSISFKSKFQSPQLISLSPPCEQAEQKGPSGSGYSMDLEGIDFFATNKPTTARIKPNASSEDLSSINKIYPDISSAFRDVKTDQSNTRPSAAPFPDWTKHTGPTPSSAPQRKSMPMPYAWEQGASMEASAPSRSSISVPTTPLQGSFYNQPQPPAYGFNVSTAVPAINANFLPNQTPGNTAGFASGASFGNAGSRDLGTFNQIAFGNVSDSSVFNQPAFVNLPASHSTALSSVMNYDLVPNIDFPVLPDTDAFSNPSISDSHVDTSELTMRPRKNSDLIELGFEGILTSDEKEYFSLEYFDPLHRKGRTTSVSSPDEASRPIPSQYFFAKPPEETGIVSTDRDLWVTFDGTGSVDLGSTDTKTADTTPADKVTESVFVTPDSTQKGHDQLRKKVFVDEESDAFCQMVAELKGEYKSTDEKTNLGFIVSPMCDKQQEAMSVKIVVHSVFADEPLMFTSDVHSLVEHVINNVLYNCLAAHLPSHMVESLKSVDFILKVYDKSEYLLNEYALSKYGYTHDCLKMDQDLCFQIMRRQDVALPFLRTIDDDVQNLYFPQENIKETDVTRESLGILMDTFYKEVERVTDLVLKDEVSSVRSQSLSQSVKAICNILSKIETIDIAKSLQKVESLIKQLKGSGDRTGSLERSGGYDSLPRNSLERKVSIIPSLEEALDKLVSAVKQLVRIYCQAFHTDFHLGTKVDQPWDPKDVTGYNESFIVQICTAHRIPDIWSSKFDEYKVECALYHGKRKLSMDISTSVAGIDKSGLVQRIIWDEWLTFEEISLCLLPRETRLCITLIGLKYIPSTNASNTESQKLVTILGGVTLQLFKKNGYMCQGSQLVPFQMKTAADPATPFCSTLQPDSALLQVNLPDFGKQIVFSDPLKMPESKKRTFSELAPQVQEEIKDVMVMDCVASCTADHLEVLWAYRHYLHDYPRLLPWILQAAHGWDWACLPEIYCLLREWKTLQPMQSLELLLPQYPDVNVRAFAVECLRQMATDDLIDFIPQLIQALKYESYHASPLARLLLEQSCTSVRFAHQFFWLLKGATQDRLYKRRYELMFVALVSVAGESLYQEFMKQEEIVKILTTMAEKVQAAKDKEATLKDNLQILFEKFRNTRQILLPYNPAYEVSGIERNSCSYFPSNALPLKLVFRNATEKAGPVYAMFKVGDDLRQDMMTMQIVRIMDRLWLREGLDLKMIAFSCLPTGPRRGFIEIITESETLRKIQVSSGVTGSFKDRPIKDWLQRHNPTELEYQKAVENFSRSCAGYCVVTYVLGVCDRHNDNIMLKQSGHMFHIDFNKILGDAQMFGSIKRDRVKFVFTSDMAYVINDGDRQTDKFQHFVDMCCQAFNILRNHANLFINIVSLMLRSGIPGITEKGVEFIQKALLPGYTDAQASEEFTKMIQESQSARSTQINFFIHNLAQMKFSSHNEGALLSFVPKVYSQQTDGKIKSVVVHGFQKRYTPEKHYIYTLRVERELQRVPSYVFRIFSEFVEFRNKLQQMFQLITWPPLQGRVILGRSHIKTVAENRKTELDRFIEELFRMSPEVSHCDMVYTFFHPLLRDEQEAQKEKFMLPKLRETPVQLQRSTGSGQVKLSLEYVKDTLHVMIMHARDLPVSGSELPSPYVKTYLLPDPEKHTKRKTKISKESTHPTYNELIGYKLPSENLRQKTLQVTVWDQGVLKENNLIGAVYIRLRDLDLTKVVANWYKLDKLQITDGSTL